MQAGVAVEVHASRLSMQTDMQQVLLRCMQAGVAVEVHANRLLTCSDVSQICYCGAVTTEGYDNDKTGKLMKLNSAKTSCIALAMIPLAILCDSIRLV